MMADGGYMVVLRRFDSSPSIFPTEVYVCDGDHCLEGGSQSG